MSKERIIITMTFRDSKVSRFFSERCSNTKFDRAWAIRRIFMGYFPKIKADSLNIFDTNRFYSYGEKGGRGKIHEVSVTFSDPEVIEFFNKFKNKKHRAYFLKGVVMLYFYGRKEYNNPNYYKSGETETAGDQWHNESKVKIKNAESAAGKVKPVKPTVERPDAMGDL